MVLTFLFGHSGLENKRSRKIDASVSINEIHCSLIQSNVLRTLTPQGSKLTIEVGPSPPFVQSSFLSLECEFIYT